MDNLLTVLALLWIIYTFLLSDSDRKVESFIQRMKFALSIVDGSVNLPILTAQQHLSVIQIKQLGNRDGHITAMVNKFVAMYDEINTGKKFLEINILLLTVVVLVSFVSPQSVPILFIKIYFITSLLFAAIFYFFTGKLEKQEFSKIESDPKAALWSQKTL